MALTLSENDKAMLDGAHGEAARFAMRIVSRMAEVEGATELMDITQAHIDACGLLSEAGLEFAEALAAKGGRVRVPTTLNMGPLDLQNWREFGVPEEFAARAIRQANAYEGMGCLPTWTCAPYQGYLTPRFGQQIAWGESNAIVYANSVLGARTNRYGDFMDICAAVTGRVPRCGLHLKANRRGQVLVRITGIPESTISDPTFYPIFGHWLGERCESRIPVIEGLPRDPSDDALKALGAAAASAGAIALFHAVGVTPEALDRETAFQGGQPEKEIEFSEKEFSESRHDLGPVEDGRPIDCVVLGCPHYSFAEFRELARCIEAEGGRKTHADVAIIIATSRQSFALLKTQPELLRRIEEFGVRITLDTCVFHSPIVHDNAKVIMTDSGKCAYYSPGELDVKVAFGSMADCVHSAAEGKVCRII